MVTKALGVVPVLVSVKVFKTATRKPLKTFTRTKRKKRRKHFVGHQAQKRTL